MGEYESKDPQVAPKPGGKSSAPGIKQDPVEQYLTDDAISRKLRDAVEAHLGKVDLPAPPRAAWSDEDGFVRSTLDYLKPRALFFKRERLSELLFPARPYETLERVAPRGFAWSPAVGVALAPLFEEAIAHADPVVMGSRDKAEQQFGLVAQATRWDAPAESGNFAGGFAATATQTSRYAQHQAGEKKGP